MVEKSNQFEIFLISMREYDLLNHTKLYLNFPMSLALLNNAVLLLVNILICISLNALVFNIFSE